MTNNSFSLDDCLVATENYLDKLILDESVFLFIDIEEFKTAMTDRYNKGLFTDSSDVVWNVNEHLCDLGN